MSVWDNPQTTGEATTMSTSTPTTTQTTTTSTISGSAIQYITSAVTLVTVVGLIVLIALNKITFAEGGPLIAALAGVHGGAAITNAATK